MLLLCAMVALAGCGDGSSPEADDEGHRFASDRRPTAEPTTTLSDTIAPQESSPTEEPTTSPDEILGVRGAPLFAYFIIDGELVVYDTMTRIFAPIDTMDDLLILDHASSPTGDRVGVLGVSGDDVVVQYFGADGEPLGEAIVLPISYMPVQLSPVASPEASPAATPVSTAMPINLHVSWVPQGNAVVVSCPGVLLRASMSGEVMPITRVGVTGTVVTSFWSPMDAQIAIQTQMMDGHQGVFLLDSGHAEAAELEILHIQPDQRISNLQWLPSGLGLVMVVGNNSGGELMNGQLYLYRFGDPAPTLVATSGQGGPAGTITHVAVSPDGHAVAYAVMVRDQENWHLHSLWVRPLKDGTALSIPVTTSSPITNIVWTAEGLVWQQQNDSITVIDDDLVPRPLGEDPVATPVASPQPTPVFSATPRG